MDEKVIPEGWKWNMELTLRHHTPEEESEWTSNFKATITVDNKHWKKTRSIEQPLQPGSWSFEGKAYTTDASGAERHLLVEGNFNKSH